MCLWEWWHSWPWVGKGSKVMHWKQKRTTWTYGLESAKSHCEVRVCVLERRGKGESGEEDSELEWKVLWEGEEEEENNRSVLFILAAVLSGWVDFFTLSLAPPLSRLPYCLPFITTNQKPLSPPFLSASAPWTNNQLTPPLTTFCDVVKAPNFLSRPPNNQ